jgi:hypothetical protein
MFVLAWTATAAAEYARLEQAPSLLRRFKAVKKAIRLLREDPRHPSLNTHEWKGQLCPHGDRLWEAYAENNTSGAYRIFFCYPPGPLKMICVVAITPHP